MSISSYNGCAVVAMTGKDCVAIASDKRLGVKYTTYSMDFPKVFKAADKIYIGLPGLGTDVQTLTERFRFKVNMYKMNEEREIEPRTFSNLVASTLYERRFSPYFVEPIIAGLDKNNKPLICQMDLIGCPNYPDNFVVGGTADDQLNGTCEALWEPDLEPEDLFETISQALMASTNRDCLSGWGAIVHIITPRRVIMRSLKTRMD